eukprot:CAMPEP_0117757494 /NCGR_PEP_ID=MMETSP0947-20121206/14773_1 /TAXON_ID=44440 /ORGANISM="Chattonella subsalsa, Strain CCMP2191" /LENGTH=215 /DNA_ID=CAMNT_0005577415 /DNA_START=133 /DNA_END=780 /DNA_ORIENTATION=+
MLQILLPIFCLQFLHVSGFLGSNSLVRNGGKELSDKIISKINYRSTCLSATRETRRRELSDALNPLVDIEGTDVPITEDPLIPIVKTAVKAGDMRKAEGIVAYRVTDLTLVTEFKVIMVGNSRPQNQAIAKAIMDDLEEEHGLLPRQEGKADSGWILLDYGDLIIHIMTPKSRAYYDLDGFWRNGEMVDLSDVILPNTVPSSELQKEEEVDPFWS